MASGYILKRSENCWIARVEHHRNGRRRYISKSFSTESKAKEHLQNQQSDKNRGIFVEPSKVTLSALVDEWLDGMRLRVTERTADGYEGLLDRYVCARSRQPKSKGAPKRRSECTCSALGSRRINQIETRDIQRLYACMQNHQQVGPRVVRHTHAALRQALDQAVEWKLILRNPADSLKRKLPKVSETERRYLDQAEAAAFLKVCAEKPNGLIFEFALLSGMRPEEFLAIRWRDLNLEQYTAQVKRALVRHNGSVSFQEPKTKGSKRVITLPASLCRKLIVHKRRQAEHRLKIGSDWKALDLVFCSESGTPLSIPNITNRYFHPILEKAELPRIRLYDLRHTHATLLLATHEPLKVVSQRLGHSTIRLTADTYISVLESLQQETASKLENLLYGT